MDQFILVCAQARKGWTTCIDTTVPDVVMEERNGERRADRENKDDGLYIIVGGIHRYVARATAMIRTIQSRSVT